MALLSCQASNAGIDPPLLPAFSACHANDSKPLTKLLHEMLQTVMEADVVQLKGALMEDTGMSAATSVEIMWRVVEYQRMLGTKFL